jgi:hypothetical protein
MGVEEMVDDRGRRSPRFDWQYIARHKVKDNKIFAHLVRDRASPGRLLLHIIVLDLMTWVPVQDIAIGCFHPNARGIRKGDQPDPKDHWSREIWMAVRKRTEREVSVVEPLLCRGERINDIYTDSPLGPGRRNVSNMNMRAVSKMLMK